MLLRVREGTPKSAVYKALNDELLHFLAACKNGSGFKKALFSGRCGNAIWGNAPTKKVFRHLWHQLGQLAAVDRSKAIDDIIKTQNLSEYYGDRTKEPIQLPTQIHDSLKVLTHHLFTRTSELSGIKTASGESIDEHYNEFHNINGLVCCACGLDFITALRSDIPEHDQWRGPYDHYLPEGKYPAYGIHPSNLVPICQTCNSKAKLAKDPIIDPETRLRRHAFNPHEECAHRNVIACITDSNRDASGSIPTPTFQVFFTKSHSINDEKIKTWDAIYDIKQRAEGTFSDIILTIELDCKPRDLNTLKTTIRDNAEWFGRHHREQGAMNNIFWKHKLYSWLKKQPEETISRIWICIEARRDESRNGQVFGRY